ncbi:hypothetical protein [Prosthecomicrobium pneumaticum]|uniref:Microcystin-dependent protein n=1 Tax=Prosthecomicrobium pneumaticum TaxID=81895 RepID=A0A7W9L2W6_9HYPH|nr:microcystin-dependent protein [Prosthecomicrobium pneumaticum]
MIGNTYGGNAKLFEFALPNLTGRAAVGSNQTFLFSTPGGAEKIGLTAGNLPGHRHGMSRKSPASSTSKSNLPSASADIGVLAQPSANTPLMMAEGDAAVLTLDERTIGLTSNGMAAHENRRPFLALRHLIACEGIIPDSSPGPTTECADPSGAAEA